MPKTPRNKQMDYLKTNLFYIITIMSLHITTKAAHIERPLLPSYIDSYSSQNIFMRRLFPEDYTDLLDALTDPKNMQYWGEGIALTSDETKNMVSRSAYSNFDNSGTRVWSIITHSGIAGIFFAIHNAAHTEVEIAYIIRPFFQERG